MVKTQVQIPEDLFAEAKRVANEREMSFAEVVRRGLEIVVDRYPPLRSAGEWHPVKPMRLGWRGLSADQLRELAYE